MKDTVLKWFDLLPFRPAWRQEVAKAADNFSMEAERTPMWDLVYALSRCDHVEKIFEEKGIDREILIATLSDIVVWSENQYFVHGTVGLSDAGWLEGHLEGKLFRLGRLQFKMEQSIASSAAHGLIEKDPVIEIHIPQGEPMDMDAVHASYRRAKEFFHIYFPEYEYRYFVCGSWLLDYHLKDFLKETSNILKFANEFEIICNHPSNDAMRRLFELNPNKEPENSFQKNVRTFVENGGQTLEGYGILTWDGWDDDH